MINAWSLLYEELNGTMAKTYPIKDNDMSPCKLDDPIFTVGSGNTAVASSTDYWVYTTQMGDIKIDTSALDDDIEHSDAWYDYTRNDPDRENPFTDPEDRARAERVVGGGNTAASSAEELTISIPPEFNYAESVDHLVSEMPGPFTTFSVNDDAIAHHVTTPGIQKDCNRKYKEDESIKALQDYISTTYGGHYTSDNNNGKTLDLIEAVGDAESFCRSNAIKYLSRYAKIGQAKRDILKALHYSLLLYHFSGQLNETSTRGYETF